MTLTPEMEVAVKYQSHLPALLACIAVTDGPVLELGVGHFSTPHLHALCGAMGRELVSVEPDEKWRVEFANKYTGPNHTFTSEWMHPHMRDWSVAFIDHSPGGANRAAAFKALIEECEFVVVHDAQKDAENFQAIEPMLAGLNWRLCTSIFPHTLVASKTKQIPAVLEMM
jgi:hypothetical protein